MSKHYHILSIAVICILFTGCYGSRTKENLSYVNYAKKDSTHIREMAEYALIFSRENNTTNFSIDNIADRAARKKMSSLGSIVDIIYHYAGDNILDSTVVFKSTTLSGIKEYIYDFATVPKMHGSDSVNTNFPMIQVSSRIYFRRRPFPMM